MLSPASQIKEEVTFYQMRQQQQQQQQQQDVESKVRLFCELLSAYKNTGKLTLIGDQHH
jgi:hypothetical protein